MLTFYTQGAVMGKLVMQNASFILIYLLHPSFLLFPLIINYA